MQGWRVSMEDAHACLLDFDKNTSLFGVFDGHGGSEVAIYARKHLADVLKTTDGYKNGNTKQGLTETFFKLDEDMITEKGLIELKEIAGDHGDDSDDDNETALLTQEAAIPLKELLERLRGVRFTSEGIENQDRDSDEDEDEELNGDIENKGENSHTNGSKPSHSKNDDSKTSEEEDESEEEEEDEKEDEREDEKEDEREDEKEDEREDEKEDEKEEDSEDSEEEDDDDDDENGVVFNSDEAGYDSGTTAIVALVKDDTLTVANAGDSRCVVCRNGIALEMSRDHKPEDIKELHRIQKAGGKVTGEGRVNGGLNLSRALGDHSYKGRTELKAEEQQITAMPDIRQTQLTEADEFMVMACDGIWNVKNSQEVVDFVRKELKEQRKNSDINLSSICEKLFNDCLAPDTSGDGSGCDNMTCLIVTFDTINTPLSGKRKSQDENENPKDEKKSRTE
ncbi:hypothetical protein QZH41_008221 [Actinostola sp. cb2023]|nr:hypothetical protein QZH41_008221 [Actinostola sp. cb2023]